MLTTSEKTSKLMEKVAELATRPCRLEQTYGKPCSDTTAEDHIKVESILPGNTDPWCNA